MAGTPTGPELGDTFARSVNPREIGIRVNVRHLGATEEPGQTVHHYEVRGRPTWRLLVALAVAPRLMRALAWALGAVSRMFPAAVRPTVEVVVTMPGAA